MHYIRSKWASRMKLYPGIQIVITLFLFTVAPIVTVAANSNDVEELLAQTQENLTQVVPEQAFNNASCLTLNLILLIVVYTFLKSI